MIGGGLKGTDQHLQSTGRVQWPEMLSLQECPNSCQDTAQHCQEAGHVGPFHGQRTRSAGFGAALVPVGAESVRGAGHTHGRDPALDHPRGAQLATQPADVGTEAGGDPGDAGADQGTVQQVQGREIGRKRISKRI